jgi:hypothetical protein
VFVLVLLGHARISGGFCSLPKRLKIECTREEYEAWLAYDDSKSSLDGAEVEPETGNLGEEWGKAFGFVLAGNGGVTNPDITAKNGCHRYVKTVGCLDGVAHSHMTIDGVKHCGNGMFYPVFHHCDKASCPLCYREGFAKRTAKKVAARLEFAEKEFFRKGMDVGKIEHFVISLNSKDALTLRDALNKLAAVEKARHKAWSVAVARGFVGAVLLFHVFRFHAANETYAGEPAHWFFSPHFHGCGWLAGGYARCRSCQDNNKFGRNLCLSCEGYEGRTRRLFSQDGYIVRVFGERKTVRGTLFYQSHHVGLVAGVERFHAVTWHGIVSYRAMKYESEKFVEIRPPSCRICGGEMKDVQFCGSDEDYAILMLAVRSGLLNRGWEEALVKNGVTQWRYSENREKGGG